MTSMNNSHTSVRPSERVVKIQVESSEEDDDDDEETETEESESDEEEEDEQTDEEETSSEESASVDDTSDKCTSLESKSKNSAQRKSVPEPAGLNTTSSDVPSGGSDPIPWRKPNLRKVGRQISATRRPSSELPAWAEEAKKRLGEVPNQPLKTESSESKPEWSDRKVDIEKLERIEKRHLERQSTSATGATEQTPEWTRKKIGAAALGRLERANRLDKKTSFDKPAAAHWKQKLQPPDYSKLRDLETRDKSAPLPAEHVTGAWEVKLKPPPPPPPPPPMAHTPAPPPPPPPPFQKSTQHQSELSESRRARLESLRKTARRRPDWHELMTEITAPVRGLRRVQCNDRSAPIIGNVKRRDSSFVFESEKVDSADASTKLLNDIKSGVKLKKVKCNDRSRPNLQGLRKLRRQRTSEAFLNIPPEELIDSEPEELDDIDKLRDDLQSTRQLLGEEVKACEKLTKENRHLKNEISRLQEMLQALTHETTQIQQQDGGDKTKPEAGDTNEKVASLRSHLESANNAALTWQHKFGAAEAEIALLKRQLEKTNAADNSVETSDVSRSKLDNGIQKTKSSAKVARSKTKDKLTKSPTKQSMCRKSAAEVEDAPSHEAVEHLETENGNTVKNSSIASQVSEDNSDEEVHSNDDKPKPMDEETKRGLRDLKMCKSRISHISTKEKHAKEEQTNLKNRIKSLTLSIKDENRKYKELEREVHNMGAVMKGSDGETDDDDQSSDEDDEDDGNDGASGGSETSSEEESSDESETDDDSLPMAQRLQIIQQRAKRHEDNEKAIKKGNYMLRTTVERLFDKLRNEKEKYRILEHELNDLVNEMA